MALGRKAELADSIIVEFLGLPTTLQVSTTCIRAFIGKLLLEK